MLDPILREEVAKLEDKVDLARVDVDKLTELAISYEVASIPYVVGFTEGKKTSFFVGAKGQDDVAEFLKDLVK